VWLPKVVVEDMAATMLRLAVPGVFLGLDMMPWTWALGTIIAFICIFVFLKTSPLGRTRRKRWLLVALGSSALTIAFYFLAVLRAKESCSEGPADGFCVFDGFPSLSLSALSLIVATVAWVQTVRLRDRKIPPR
jgi:hypothetical protein